MFEIRCNENDFVENEGENETVFRDYKNDQSQN